MSSDECGPKVSIKKITNRKNTEDVSDSFRRSESVSPQTDTERDLKNVPNVHV